MFVALNCLVPWLLNATNGICVFKLCTTSPLTYGISAVDQRVLLLGCQSRIDEIGKSEEINIHDCPVNMILQVLYRRKICS